MELTSLRLMIAVKLFNRLKERGKVSQSNPIMVFEQSPSLSKQVHLGQVTRPSHVAELLENA